MCMFCNKPAVKLGEYYVCDECQTVCFSKNIPLEEKYYLIRNFLSDIQCGVLKQQDILRDIEQEYISRGELTHEEFEIRNKVAEFQSLRLELEFLINNNSQLCEKSDRNLLYRLLVLSEWLSKNFKMDK